MLSLDLSDNVKSLGTYHSKYTKEILKITKKNKETGYFHFLPLKTILCDIYVIYMTYMTYMTCMTSDICFDTHIYICQYGCQNKCQGLRNAANHLRYPITLF